ncbi:MAG: hypothetical protein ACXQS8_01675 [Candidatus Helarchaeales archaeon]
MTKLPLEQYHEKIKDFLLRLGVKEYKEDLEQHTIDVPLKIEFDPGESIELNNRILLTEEGWILIKCLLTFNDMIPPDPEIRKNLWAKLLQSNFKYPEVTYSLDGEYNVFIETDMPLETDFINFESEYKSILVGALNYFSEVLPSIGTDIEKVDTFERIHHLYLFKMDSGILIHDYPFKLTREQEPQLVSSGLTGLGMLIKEITKKETQVKIIEQEGMTILLEHGNYISGALISEENRISLRKKLRELIEKTEQVYKDQLAEFSGNISQFEDLRNLITKIFSPVKE